MHQVLQVIILTCKNLLYVVISISVTLYDNRDEICFLCGLVANRSAILDFLIQVHVLYES